MPTRVSLKYAGWLPQDRGFESELSSVSRIEREHVGAQYVLIELTRVTPKRLPTPCWVHPDNCGVAQSVVVEDGQ